MNLNSSIHVPVYGSSTPRKGDFDSCHEILQADPATRLAPSSLPSDVLLRPTLAKSPVKNVVAAENGAQLFLIGWHVRTYNVSSDACP